MKLCFENRESDIFLSNSLLKTNVRYQKVGNLIFFLLVIGVCFCFETQQKTLFRIVQKEHTTYSRNTIRITVMTKINL